MSHRIPIAPETLPGMTTGQVVQMRDHLAQPYSWRFGTQVPFDVLRHAGNQAIAATITATAGPTETMALADLLSHQMKGRCSRPGRPAHTKGLGHGTSSFSLFHWRPTAATCGGDCDQERAAQFIAVCSSVKPQS